MRWHNPVAIGGRAIASSGTKASSRAGCRTTSRARILRRRVATLGIPPDAAMGGAQTTIRISREDQEQVRASDQVHDRLRLISESRMALVRLIGGARPPIETRHCGRANNGLAGDDGQTVRSFDRFAPAAVRQSGVEGVDFPMRPDNQSDRQIRGQAPYPTPAAEYFPLACLRVSGR